MNLLHTGEETLMKRRIIKIDENKCNGCGLCAKACHEGAIGMVNGKAKLLRDDYCDGLGDCLPHCPTDAITFEEREALPYDREAVEAKMRAEGKPVPPQDLPRFSREDDGAQRRLPWVPYEDNGSGGKSSCACCTGRSSCKPAAPVACADQTRSYPGSVL